jgi:hypothetical protein
VNVLGDYGMITISPPQEDLRVGDFFLYDSEPDNTSRFPGNAPRTMATALRWGSLPVMAELKKEYLARPAWPATADSLLQTHQEPITRKWPEAKAEGNESIFASDAAPNRLRSLHISSYLTATFTGDHINVLIPTEAVNMVLGTAWLDNKVAMVTLHGAESYELPVIKIIDLMMDKEEVFEEVMHEEDSIPATEASLTNGENPIESEFADPATNEAEPSQDDTGEVKRGIETRYVLKSDYREHLEFLAQPLSDRVWIQVVTEVLYIRGMDIAVQTRTSFDEEEGLKASELEIDDSHEESKSEQEITSVQETPSKESSDGNEEEDDELDPAFGAFVRAKAINELLAESGVSDTPDETFRFLTVTDNSVSMRRIWSRGLAIGVRGLILEVDKHTGEVLRVDVLK